MLQIFLAAFNAFLIATVLGSFIRGWRSDDWTWSGLKLLVGIMMLLDLIWPQQGRSKRIQYSIAIMAYIATALFAAGGWRSAIGQPASPVPRIFNMAPATAFQGQTLDVNISAAGAAFADASNVNLGPGITILTARTINNTTLMVRIRIDNDAARGYRRVWVQTPGAQTAIDNSPAGAFPVFAPAQSLRY